MHYLNRTDVLCSQPRLLCELLCVVRVIIYKFHNQIGCILIYALACICEATIKELHKIRSVNLVEEHQIAELVKWFRRVGKYLHHHMSFATIQAVSNILMLLPMRA